MVNRITLRTFCLVVGFILLILSIVKTQTTFTKVMGVVFSLCLIIFGYLITGKWAKYIVGEEMNEDSNKGSFG